MSTDRDEIEEENLMHQKDQKLLSIENSDSQVPLLVLHSVHILSVIESTFDFKTCVVQAIGNSFFAKQYVLYDRKSHFEMYDFFVTTTNVARNREESPFRNTSNTENFGKVLIISTVFILN